MRSPVETHDMVPSLQDNPQGQAHSRVPECDGGPSVQIKPSPINRMVTASAAVQTDLSKVVKSSCGPFCYSAEPQVPLYVSPVPDQHAWDIVALNTLVGSPTQDDPKLGKPIASSL